MRLLFVAMADSVHTARWVAQLSGRGWDVHVASCAPCGRAHPQLRDVTVHHLSYACRRPDVRQRGLLLPHPLLAHLAERGLDRMAPSLRARRLADLVRRLRPDVVHSLEIQHAGYLTLRARALVGGAFPPWAVANWGSDIFHFRHDPSHAARIREVLAACDAYTCECRRDVLLAAEMGFSGTTFPPSPNAGGYDLVRAAGLRSGPPSGRRLVMVKGYQHWVGRALIALQALEASGSLLEGYQLCIYSASPEVVRAARNLASRTRLPVEVFTQGNCLPHDEMLARHGRARASIGLSMSDGLSTSFLEAMMMGSFPIQSWTSCANEWIEDGRSGLLVPPEDVDDVARAVHTALTRDDLVDAAAERNWATARDRLDSTTLAAGAVDMYERLAGARHAP